MNFNLALPFFATSQLHPNRTAAVVNDRVVTYAELCEMVQSTAAWLLKQTGGRVQRVGILASRSLETYVGILATNWAGGAYVPLNVKMPEERLLHVMERTKFDALVVGSEALGFLTERVRAAAPANVLAAFGEAAGATAHHKLTRASDVFALADAGARGIEPVEVAGGDPAYILYTSGTTGAPKGVVIPASAVAHFLGMMKRRYELTSADRIAAITDITFDLSVFDLFGGWAAGASLWTVPAGQVMAPMHFIQNAKATVAFTVPSVAAWMNRMKLLTPGAMPSLRYVLLAGEPLPMSVAAAFQKAAPNAVVDNLYGPTEATVVCSGQRFTGDSDETPERNVVSIGPPLEGSELAVVDEQLRPADGTKPGEILISGPQLALGYFGNEEQTARHFVHVNGKRWYRTGDLGYRDAGGRFHHLGRIDNQVKVRGMRVELEEIEAHLRAVYQTESVAAVAWPMEHGSAAGIVAFVASHGGASSELSKDRLRKRLPPHMVPSAIYDVAALPLNANGKVDRKALAARLERGQGAF
jgi:amino acid adenylation domain-containing protein